MDVVLCWIKNINQLINKDFSSEIEAIFSFLSLFFFFFFLGLHPWHMEIPRLGVKSELQLPTYITATAVQDPSHVCLHNRSRQRQILNLLSRVRDQTCILMDTNWVNLF